MRVPAAEAEVEPADARAVVVDDDDLLVVRPELDIICGRAMRRDMSGDSEMGSPLLPMWSGWRMQAMLGWRSSSACLVWLELMDMVWVTSL